MIEIAVDLNFVRKRRSSNGGTIWDSHCFDRNSANIFASNYQIYDSNGKAVVVEEGFPIRRLENNVYYYGFIGGQNGLSIFEKYAGFSGKMFDGGAANAFTHGNMVYKTSLIEGMAEYEYRLDRNEGRLFEVSNIIVKLKDMKNRIMIIGEEEDMVAIKFNGTHFNQVGKSVGGCWPYNIDVETQKITYSSKLLNIDTKEQCYCAGRTTGDIYNQNKYEFLYNIESMTEPTLYKFESMKHFVEDVDIVIKGTNGKDSYGGIQLEKVRTVRLSGLSMYSFKKGTTITQGTASGTVAASSPLHFTNLICSSCVNISYSLPKSNCDCSGTCQISNYRAPSLSSLYVGGSLVEQQGTGATGIVDGGYGQNMYVIQTSTANFANNGGNLILKTPDGEKEWKNKKISGTVQLSGNSQIRSDVNFVKVNVASGIFISKYNATTTLVNSNVASILVNGTDNVGIPSMVQTLRGTLVKEPHANTNITISSRIPVIPGEKIADQLHCYHHCPRQTGISQCKNKEMCYEAASSVLTDIEIVHPGAGCSGNASFTFKRSDNSEITNAAATGVIESGSLTFVQLLNYGSVSCFSNSYHDKPSIEIQVSGNCTTSFPVLALKCETGTDTVRGLPQAKTYTYDGVLRYGTDPLIRSYTARSLSHPVVSGILFPNTVDVINALSCDTNENLVCLNNLRRKGFSFYQYETGSKQSQTDSISDEGHPVQPFKGSHLVYKHEISSNRFNAAFGVADDTHDGSTFSLLYEGNGKLYGLPYTCINEVTGMKIDCSPKEMNIVPDFVIGDRSRLIDNVNGVAYYVKPFEVGQYLIKSSSSASCSKFKVPTISKPTKSSSGKPELAQFPNKQGTRMSVIGGIFVNDIEAMKTNNTFLFVNPNQNTNDRRLDDDLDYASYNNMQTSMPNTNRRILDKKYNNYDNYNTLTPVISKAAEKNKRKLSTVVTYEAYCSAYPLATCSSAPCLKSAVQDIRGGYIPGEKGEFKISSRVYNWRGK